MHLCSPSAPVSGSFLLLNPYPVPAPVYMLRRDFPRSSLAACALYPSIPIQNPHKPPSFPDCPAAGSFSVLSYDQTHKAMCLLWSVHPYMDNGPQRSSMTAAPTFDCVRSDTQSPHPDLLSEKNCSPENNSILHSKSSSDADPPPTGVLYCHTHTCSVPPAHVPFYYNRNFQKSLP